MRKGHENNRRFARQPLSAHSNFHRLSKEFAATCLREGDPGNAFSALQGIGHLVIQSTPRLETCERLVLEAIRGLAASLEPPQRRGPKNER